MTEDRSEDKHPTESISSVVGWAASGGLCPHWCKDTRTGPHWHDFVESLEAAGYAVTVHADEMPPVKVVHIIEAHFCRNCGAMCPSCVRTDEATPSGREARDG